MRVLVGISTEQNITNPTMGSERQTLGYSNALASIGHSVYLVNLLKGSPDWSIDYDVCMLINASGLKGPYILTAQLCREKGIPVLAAPVYWPTDEVQKEIMKLDGFSEEGEALANKFSMHISGVAAMLPEADWLLPNAQLEMDQVAKLFSDGEEFKYRVIHNGIDVENEIMPALNDSDIRFDERLEALLHDRFVLCVGRIEARKNQGALVEAMRPLWEEDPDLQLVLMGDRSAPYVKHIKEDLKGKNVLFCPSAPPGTVMRMMRRASAHCLLSFLETPGLVNLEAAALETPIVMSERGSVREYFGERQGVFYCEPTDIPSVTEALRSALACGKVKSLGEFVRSEYSYIRIAKNLEKTYIMAKTLYI